MRPPRRLALATFAVAALFLTACSGGDSEADPRPSQTSEQASDQAAGVSEASKGEACEAYRDLSAQVEAATEESLSITVSSEEDGRKVTELKTKVSELTEKADAAYGLCYAEGAEPESTS